MIKPDELMAQGFRPYRKITITYARQMPKRFRIRLDTGDVIGGKLGDYACVSPDDGGKWIVARDVFERTYVPATRKPLRKVSLHKKLAESGFRPYMKHQITWAQKISKPRMIRTMEGEVMAKAGDYLCVGPDGEQWPQEAHRFEAHYQLVTAQAG
ncbi:MAG: hypothetical protein CL610_13330 [Anaerolineaceae bacterium]|nr:hypothetical protein [Anaerolineaceae bacterium]